MYMYTCMYMDEKYAGHYENNGFCQILTKAWYLAFCTGRGTIAPPTCTYTCIYSTCTCTCTYIYVHVRTYMFYLYTVQWC